MQIGHKAMTGKDTKWGLLAIYLRGELPKERLGELQEFLEENPDLEQYKDDMRMLAGSLPRTRKLSQQEIAGQYALLAGRIAAGESHSRGRSRWAYAAGIGAAAMLAIFAYNTWLGDQPATGLLAVDDLVPAQTKQIEVITAGGDTVRFDLSDNVALPGAVVEQNELRYDAQAAPDSPGATSFNTIHVPGRTILKTVLPDGSAVYLNSVSQLKFPASFSGSERRVELVGEAYFEVVKDAKRPFIVTTKSQSIKVLGTSFNVSAYADDRCESVVLASGSVSLSAANNAPLTMKPGEMATLQSNSGQYLVENVNTRNYSAWKDGVFIFNRMPLDEIMARLARWYDVDIVFADPRAGKLHFTGAVEKEWTLSYALEMIRSTTDISFASDGQAIVIGMQ